MLIASREVAVAKHAIETAQALYADSRTRVDAGLAVDSDALSAQVNLAARQQELIQAQGEEQSAWAELEAAVGAPLPQGPEGWSNSTSTASQPRRWPTRWSRLSRAGRPQESCAAELRAAAAVQAAKSEFGPRG